MPVKRLVKVEAPCLATPRTDMQVCSASIITATPRGFRTSSIAADLGGQMLLGLQAAGEDIGQAREL
jgi:hypothetical protein